MANWWLLLAGEVLLLLMLRLWQLWTESGEGKGDLYGRSESDFAAGLTTHYTVGHVSASSIHVAVDFFLA
jgi:hypothetical protein